MKRLRNVFSARCRSHFGDGSLPSSNKSTEAANWFALERAEAVAFERAAGDTGPLQAMMALKRGGCWHHHRSAPSAAKLHGIMFLHKPSIWLLHGGMLRRLRGALVSTARRRQAEIGLPVQLAMAAAAQLRR